MIAWPQNIAARELSDAEPVGEPLHKTARHAAPPVDLDIAAPTGAAAPPLPTPTAPLYRRRQAQAYSAGLLLALGASAMVHAAIVAYLGEHTARAGPEAETDAMSVEIIFEAPPARHLAGSAAATLRPDPPSAAPPANAEKSQPPEREPTEIAPLAFEEAGSQTEQTQRPDLVQPTGAREKAEREEIEPTASNAETASTQKSAEPLASAAKRADLAAEAQKTEAYLEELSTPPEDSVPESTAGVILPTEDIPVPSARPAPPKGTPALASDSSHKQTRSSAESPRRQAKAPEPRPEKQAAAPAKPAAKKAEPARQGATASVSGRTGGATAGEKTAYSRQLLRHVERHKRYPREAERQGISGAAALAITIDRQGRLAGARLSRSSGHAVLDEAALAVARRAAPYPRPPEGVGGNIMTFSVTLRFAR